MAENMEGAEVTSQNKESPQQRTTLASGGHGAKSACPKKKIFFAKKKKNRIAAKKSKLSIKICNMNVASVFSPKVQNHHKSTNFSPFNALF